MQKDYSRVPEMPQEAPPAPAPAPEPAQTKRRGRPRRTTNQLEQARRLDQILYQGPRGSAAPTTTLKRGGRE